MKVGALNILIVDGEAPVTAAIAAVLQRRGHVVATANNAEEALAQASPDVLVCDFALADASGLELYAEIKRRGARPRTVFLTGEPSVDDCKRALWMGASEYLTKPFRLEELVRAIEARPAPRAEAAFERSYTSSPACVEQASRDLAAFALRCRICPSGRARIATACSEILDNARRHGYHHAPGQIVVRAAIEAQELAVAIVDEGKGFDAANLGPECWKSTLHNGLARALALCESLHVESQPGSGTRVALRFASARTDFDEDGCVDLSELDFLLPNMSRRVLHALCKHDTADLYRLSPSLAVVVGRLLAGPDPKQVVQHALWSC